MEKIKVMTFNTQHLSLHKMKPDDVIDPAPFAKVIRANEAQIIGLNEVYSLPNDEKFANQPYQVSKLLPDTTSIFSQAVVLHGKPYGNGMITYFPIIEEKTYVVPEPNPHNYNGYYEQRGILCTLLSVNGKEISVLVTHFGLNPDEAEASVKKILQIASEIKTPILLMGDFNLTPDSEILKPLYEVFDDAGKLIDGENFTYDSLSPKIKIDYIMTRGMKNISCRVVKEVVSDHFPLFAELEF